MMMKQINKDSRKQTKTPESKQRDPHVERPHTPYLVKERRILEKEKKSFTNYLQIS